MLQQHAASGLGKVRGSLGGLHRPLQQDVKVVRLVALRESLQAEHPDWWNGPVTAFGDPAAWLGIIGLAAKSSGAGDVGVLAMLGGGKPEFVTKAGFYFPEGI